MISLFVFRAQGFLQGLADRIAPCAQIPLCAQSARRSEAGSVFVRRSVFVLSMRKEQSGCAGRHCLRAQTALGVQNARKAERLWSKISLCPQNRGLGESERVWRPDQSWCSERKDIGAFVKVRSAFVSRTRGNRSGVGGHIVFCAQGSIVAR